MKLGAGYVRGQPIARIYNKGQLIYEAGPSVLTEGIEGGYTGTDPMLIEIDGFVYFATVLTNGQNVVYKIDASTKEVVDSFLLFEGYGLNDDHNTPFFQQETSGGFITGVVGHGDSNVIHYRRAADWDSLKAQATQEITLGPGNLTYLNCFIMGSKTIMVVRGPGTTEWSMLISESGAAFGSAIKIIMDDTQTYVHPVVMGDKLRLFLNRNSNVTSSRVRIADLYINAADGFAAGDIVTGNGAGGTTVLINVFSNPNTGANHVDCTAIIGPLGPDLYIAPFDWGPDGKSVSFASMGNSRSQYWYAELKEGLDPFASTSWAKWETRGKNVSANTGEGASGGRWIGRVYISRESGLAYPRLYECRELSGRWELVIKDAINVHGSQYLEEVLATETALDSHVLFRPYPCRDTSGAIPFVVMSGTYVEYYSYDTVVKWPVNDLPAQQVFELLNVPLKWRVKTYGVNGSDFTFSGSEISEYSEITGNYPRTVNLQTLRTSLNGDVNGLPALLFLGGQRLVTEHKPKSAGHFAALLKQSNRTGTQEIAGASDSSSARVRFELQASTGQLQAIIGAGATMTFTFANLPALNEPFVAGLSWDGAEVKAYLSTAAGDFEETRTQAGTAATVNRSFWLGCLNNNNAPALYMQGAIADAVFADQVLTGTDWTSVRDYLKQQGGII